MTVELHIRAEILGVLVARSVHERLRAASLPPLGEFYVDHLDVADEPVRFDPTGTVVRIRVPVDVFVVSRDDLLNAPNDEPAAVRTPVSRVGLILELSSDGGAAVLRVVDVDAGPVAAAAGAAHAAIVAALSGQIRIELGAVVEALGLPAPTTSSVVLAGTAIAVRFDPAGPAVERLFPGQDWGLFVSGGAIEQLVQNRLPALPPALVTSASVTPHWRPAGTTPHVDLDYAGKPVLPDPFTADVDGTFFCDLTLLGAPEQKVRVIVRDWSLHIHAAGIPGIAESEIEQSIMDAFTPSAVGGTALGGHSFAIDGPRLPDIGFADGQLAYESAYASPDGMTIGGPVRVYGGAVLLHAGLSWDRVRLVKSSDNPMQVVVFCSQGGSPDQTISPDSLGTSGDATFTGIGAYGGFEVVSGGPAVPEHIHVDQRNADTLRVHFGYSALAEPIADRVRLIVRTGRGVRCVDFGQPTSLSADEAATMAGFAQVIYIDDCPIIVEHTDPALSWVDQHPQWNKWQPDDAVALPERQDWSAYTAGLTALGVQLVTLTGLDAGELVTFRSREHEVTVTADAQGRAVVPVFLSVRDRLGPARLTRVTRRSLDGAVSVRSAVFRRRASLPAGVANRLTVEPDGRALVTADLGDRQVIHAVTGTTLRALPGDQRVRPTPPRAVTADVDLPGVETVIGVPGFGDEPIALALMSDGRPARVLDLTGGTPRVAGMIHGPVGRIDEQAPWAIADGPGVVSLFHVTRN
ncbi:MAG: hypothetical protein HOV76_18725 [Hamadaea sp.]|nr:hypothetical protein [Hamadaea sp.]